MKGLTSLTTNIRWRPRAEHPTTFENGERMLIAVNVKVSTDSFWSIHLITVYHEAGIFELTENGMCCDWGWDQVDYWCPLSEVTAGLLKEEDHA